MLLLGRTQVLPDECGHLEHRDFVLAHDGLQRGVAEDIALVCRVLKVVRLDVDLQALGDLCPWQWLCADDLCKFGARLESLHEGSGFRGRRAAHWCLSRKWEAEQTLAPPDATRLSKSAKEARKSMSRRPAGPSNLGAQWHSHGSKPGMATGAYFSS